MVTAQTPVPLIPKVLFRKKWMKKTKVELADEYSPAKQPLTRMWANAQRDGRPAKYRWRPLFNAAKFG